MEKMYKYLPITDVYAREILDFFLRNVIRHAV